MMFWHHQFLPSLYEIIQIKSIKPTIKNRDWRSGLKLNGLTLTQSTHQLQLRNWIHLSLLMKFISKTCTRFTIFLSINICKYRGLNIKQHWDMACLSHHPVLSTCNYFEYCLTFYFLVVHVGIFWTPKESELHSKISC